MTPAKMTPREWIRRIVFFFPFQLLLAQFKRNHFTLILWILLFMAINGQFASRYGIHALLLFPEYLDSVGLLSHLILGMAAGGFIIAYHITNYIINGYRFPVLATFNNPFYKFSLNNSLIPLIFILNHIWAMYQFQIAEEFISSGEVVVNLLGYVVGASLIISLSVIYFLNTDKGILKPGKKHRSKEADQVPAKDLFGRNILWYRLFKTKQEGWKIATYMASPFRMELARSSTHYKIETLMKVFSRNHMNATFFEIAVLVMVFVFGIFRDVPVLEIPAGSSIFLLFTIGILISGALYTWLKGWTGFIIVLLLVVINFLSQYAEFNYRNFAYGLVYEGVEIPYNESAIHEAAHDSSWNADARQIELQVLENWKLKQDKDKPLLVLVNVSGGGMRSSLWTFTVLQNSDSKLGGQLYDAAHIISGSSGGMIGAAYYRELFNSYGQKQACNPKFRKNISKDLLNPIALTLTLNDVFPRWQKFSYEGQRYTKDRGYAFEKGLEENLVQFKGKKLKDYRNDELMSYMPSMLFSPTINNDGRRLLVGSRSYSFLTTPECNLTEKESHVESIDFMRFMNQAGPENLKMSSALRMSATFPYVMPNVSMPTYPHIELADAGIRDNFGFLSTLQYILEFEEWIEENTSGVVVLQIRDQVSKIKIRKHAHLSLFSTLTNPLKGFYANWVNYQEYNQDQYKMLLDERLGVPLHLMLFEGDWVENRKVSLSWHLTQKEKETINESWFSERNQETMRQLEKLLK